MWHQMFSLDPSILEKILRPLAIYVFLLVAIRIGGQRELGQSNILQFILLLSVANAVQNGIIGTDDSITGALIGAITLFTANGIVELIASRNRRFHALVIGRPIDLMTRGLVNHRVLRRQRLNEDDLLQAANAAGLRDLQDVDHAVLTASGQIVIVPKDAQSTADQIRELNSKIDTLIEKLNKQ
jgi:uncharacterized membrane protein YcaP (DUF421 family)